MPANDPKCPICHRPSGPPRVFPFCSPRCADVDLGRWFSGTYALPGDEEGGEAAPIPPPEP